MWRNYVLEISRRSSSSSGQLRSFVHSSVRFDLPVHKGRFEIALRTHTTVDSPPPPVFMERANGPPPPPLHSKKRRKKEPRWPLRPARLTFPRCDFPKCPTKVFRISFSVLRSQYANVLQPEALVASVSRHSHNTGRYALSSERITRVSLASHYSLSFSLLFFYYPVALYFSQNECYVQSDSVCTRR